MKTLKFLVFAAMFLNPIFTFADGWHKESVTGRLSEKAGGKPAELTAEEVKQGGVLSTYEACKGYVMVGEISQRRGASLKQKADDFWSAHATKCDSGTSNCDLKPVKLPAEKQSGDVMKFLDGVRVRAIADMSNNIKKYSTMRFSCLDVDYKKDKENKYIPTDAINKSNPECDGWIADVRKRISVERADFRGAAARMRMPTDEDVQRAIVSNDVMGLINVDLSAATTSSYIPKMEKLTNAEVDTAKKTFEKAISQARKEFAEENEKLLAPLKTKGREIDLINERKRLERAENLSVKVKAALAKVRLEALKDYNSSVSRAPEIAYVGSANAESKDLAAGLGKLIQDTRESLARMNDKDGSPLQYAAYSRLINKMLTEEMNAGSTNSCGLATAAHEMLESRETRNGLLATGGLVGGSMLIAAGAGIAGAFGATVTPAMIAASSQLAIATGVIGGFTMTGFEIAHAANTAQDARTGLTEKEDADKAKGAAVLGAVASPLNFLGSGALIGTTAGVVAGQSAKVWAKLGLALADKGEIKAGTASAGEIAKLAATAAADKGAASGEAQAAAKELAKLGDNAAQAILHRAPDAADEKAVETMANSGALGTPAKPDYKVANAYADVTMKMDGADRAKYAADLKKVTEAGGLKPSTETVGAGAERAQQANVLAVKIAAGSPNPEATAQLLRGTSGWNTDSLRGVEAVLDRGKVIVRKGESIGAANERAIAEATGKPVGSPEVKKLCNCSKLCVLVGGSGKKAENRFPASEKEEMSVAACTLNPY